MLHINGERYKVFSFLKWQNVDVDDLWLQQDDVACLTANEAINLLKEAFGERIISRPGSVTWPPRSRKLTSLDSFLWRYEQSDILEENIASVIAGTGLQLLQRVVQSWASRLEFIQVSRSGHIAETVFKT